MSGIRGLREAIIENELCYNAVLTKIFSHIIDVRNVMGTTSIHTHGCRISDEWTLRGMRTAVLENELIRVTVLLDRGA